MLYPLHGTPRHPGHDRRHDRPCGKLVSSKCKASPDHKDGVSAATSTSSEHTAIGKPRGGLLSLVTLTPCTTASAYERERAGAIESCASDSVLALGLGAPRPGHNAMANTTAVTAVASTGHGGSRRYHDGVQSHARSSVTRCVFRVSVGSFGVIR